MNRSLTLLLGAAAAAIVWWSSATVRYAPALEAARPSAVYDFFSYYRPNAAFAFGRLREGEIPLWNPWQQLGEPFLATLQTGVLYPPNALHLWLSPQPAFVRLAAAHLVLAMLAAAALARRCGAGAAGAASAGLLFAGSLQLWGAVWTPPTLYSAAWMPAVLSAVIAGAEAPSVRRAALLALALGFQLLVGWPYTGMMTAGVGIVLGSAILLQRAHRERRVPLGGLAVLAGGAVGGVLLAAPQLLPSLELMTRSARALGTIAESTAGLEAPPHDPSAVLRQFFQTGISGALPGFAAIPAALAALLLRGPGRLRCALLVAAGGVALAASFPLHLPVYDALRELPLLGDFRFPFRYRLVTTLAMAVVAGVGVSRLAARAGRKRRWVALGLAAGVVLAAWIPLLRAQGGSIYAFPREQPRPSQALARHLAVVAAPEHETTRSLWNDFGLDKLGQREGIRVLQDLEPLSLGTTSQWMQFLATGNAGGARAGAGVVEPVLGAPYSGNVTLPAEPSRSALLDLAAVRFLAVREPPDWLRERWRRVPGVDEPLLFENPEGLPRAWRAALAELEPKDPQAALERLLAPDFDLRTTVLLEPLPAGVGDREAAPTPDPTALTLLEVDAPERVVIRTRGARPAVLVLADAWYPGWEARLDGVAVSTLRADTAFRAALVPAGEHLVEWRYRPASFRLGVGLAGFAVLAIALALARRPAGSPR